MIKFNKSKIHDFQNIFIFCGNKRSDYKNYIFEDSSRLFGDEVLAPNLLECDTKDVESLDCKTGVIKDVLSQMNIDENKYLNIVDIRISDQIKEEIKIAFDDKYFSNLAAKAVQSSLSDFAKFNTTLTKSLIWPLKIKNINPKDTQYVQVLISKKFIDTRCSSLSENLVRSFNPDRYVDTQIAMFMLMTSISGSSEK
jgi:hypothetical protein